MPAERILMGVIGRPHGVRGLVHLHSYTAEPSDLPSYGVLETEQGRRFRLRWKGEGIAEVAEIVEGKRRLVNSREAAQALVNQRLYVPRERLPATDADEFYQADLLGLEAFDPTGKSLGRISFVHDYGAGTFLEIGALLIPFTKACVPVVDVAGGRVEIVVPDEIVVLPEGQKEGQNEGLNAGQNAEELSA